MLSFHSPQVKKLQLILWKKKFAKALCRIVELEKKLVFQEIGLELSLDADNFDKKSGIWLDQSPRGRHARYFDSKTLPELIEVTSNEKQFRAVQFQPGKALKIGGEAHTDHFKLPLTVVIVCRYSPAATSRGRLLQSRSPNVNWLCGLGMDTEDFILEHGYIKPQLMRNLGFI